MHGSAAPGSGPRSLLRPKGVPSEKRILRRLRLKDGGLTFGARASEAFDSSNQGRPSQYDFFELTAKNTDRNLNSGSTT